MSVNRVPSLCSRPFRNNCRLDAGSGADWSVNDLLLTVHCSGRSFTFGELNRVGSFGCQAIESLYAVARNRW